MDADRVLTQLRSITSRAASGDIDEDDAFNLVELVGSLDRHLVNGGELPEAWRVAREVKA